MQFAIIAYDGMDKDAPQRRASAREEHIALGNKLVDSGNGLFGGAIMNESGEMIGSIKIVEFESQQEFDDYWKSEPYVINGVWKTVETLPFAVGPSYRRQS